jgi:hypothetical protein
MVTDQKDPHDRARKLARLIVGDIAAHHTEKIAEGIRNDTLFEILERELDEGRKYYQKNVDPEVAAQADYFNEAVVDILVKGKGGVESKIW